MPLSRPVLLALVGAILAGAAFFATQGARQQSAEPEPEPAAKPQAAKPPAKAAAKPAKETGTAQAQSSTGRAAAQAAAPEGLPAGVARAVQGGRTTVIFFRQAGGADDAATARSVAAQRGRRGVAVFSADIKDLNRYRAVVAGLGLSQAPAVVILGKEGKARLIEGFIDPETLAQEVSDVR